MDEAVLGSKKRILELPNDDKIDMADNLEEKQESCGMKMKRSNMCKKRKIDIVDDIDVKQDSLCSIMPYWGMMTRPKKRELELLKDCDSEDKTKHYRLSSLPDCILVEILSRLPVKDAVAASVLSRPWRYLWTNITRLRFNTLILKPEKNVYKKFLSLSKNGYDCEFCVNYVNRVDHILGQITTPNIHSFNVNFPCPCSRHCMSRLKSWFEQICGRNIVEIVVSMISISCDLLQVPLPRCLLQSKSLESLELSGRLSYTLPENGIIGFTYLKKLKIGIYNQDLKSMKGVLKYIPALQVLDLFLGKLEDECVEISAPVLKSLTLWIFCDSNSRPCQGKIVIDSPKLEYLKTGGDLVWYHFVNDLTQLRNVDFSGYRYDEDEVESQVKLGRLVSCISGITGLGIHSDGAAFVPVLNNSTCGKDNGVALTEIFRNLIHLSIGIVGVNCTDQVPTWVLSKLKRIDVAVTIAKRDDTAIELLEHILGNSNVLEQLIVYTPFKHFLYIGQSREKEEVFCRALFELSRISSMCEIQFHGCHITASNNTTRG